MSSRGRARPIHSADLAVPLRAPECRMRLERAWRLKAPKTLLKQLDQRAPPRPRRQRP
ncbi:hypothetical protein WME94_45055 [Sorangium sp. So ce429]